jgi:hypothetical protein
VGRTAAKGPDFIPGTLWQSLDAKRELKAKRCALELLSKAGGIALGVVPALVETYSQESLSDEIAVKLEETVADISERAHRQGIVPTAQQFDTMAPHLFSERPIVSQLIFEEFVHEGMPHLVRQLNTRPSREALDQLLAHVDPDRALPMQAWIALAPQLSPDDGRAISQRLPKPNKSAVPRYINDYIRLAGNVVYGEYFTPLLAQACRDLGGFAIDNAQQELLSTIPLLLSSSIDPRGAQCLLGSAPTAIKRLLAMLSNGVEQDTALSILEPIEVQFSSEARSEIYAKVRDVAITPTTQAVKAIAILGRFPERKSDSIQAAFLILKSSSGDATLRESLRVATFKLLTTTGLGKEPNRFAPFLKPFIDDANPPAEILALVASVPLLQAQLVKRALQTPPTERSLSTLHALASHSDIFKQSLPALVELLKFPDAHAAITSIITDIGTPAVSHLRKAAARSNWNGRMSALNALESLKAASKAERQELFRLLTMSKECAEALNARESLCRLVKRGPEETQSREIAVSVLSRCIDAPIHEILASCNPELLLEAHTAVAEHVKHRGSIPSTYDRLVDTLTAQPTITPQNATILAALLRSREDVPGEQSVATAPSQRPSTRQRIIDYLGRTPTQAPEVVAALRSIVQETAKDSMFFLPSVRALALCGDKEYDWSGFVKNLIHTSEEGDIRREALDVVAQLPVDVVLAEVVPALESGTQEKVVGACLVGAALGPRAVPIISRLWNLRDNRSPRIRYTAVLALLQVNPLTPDLHDAVRRILVNRYYPIAERLPITWADTVAVVDMDRGAFGDVRKARLERLMRPTR